MTVPHESAALTDSPLTVGPLYTQALSKGGALLAETRTLLQAWRPGETGEELAERVLRNDILGRATARRVLDIVRVFTLRLLTPNDAPARHLRALASVESRRQVFSDLVFYYTVRQDAFLRDVAALCYWPAVRAGSLVVRNQEVQRLIAEAQLDGRIRAPWSPELRRDMAGRALIALTAFGLLEEDAPARRRVLPYQPSDGAAVYLAYLLHARGVTDASLAGQPDWAPFGLEPADVWNRLDALAGEGWFVVQRAGEVARMTWRYTTVEEMIDAIAGR